MFSGSTSRLVDNWENAMIKLQNNSRLAIKLLITPLFIGSLLTQNLVAVEAIEEMVVTGSHIKGAKISEALAVSVIDAEDIEAFGIESGEELLQLIPENGQNFFSESENISGGVNSARGDIGAFNLRNIGTGNTLVLLNGRRLVNSASFQTEEVGGSFVPVNSVNSNTIPVYGVERVEVLRDGASAIYGADAVAGVVNTVLTTDFEGLKIGLKWTEFGNLPRNDQSFRLKWGGRFNDDNTHASIFFNYYGRDRVNSQDDPRWADADLRYLIPEDSPFAGSLSFRNTSANSSFGQYDVASSLSSSHSLRVNDITDSSGEFEVYPVGDARCQYIINEYICGAEDGQGTERYNLNENRDLASDLQRFNLFAYIHHDLDNGMQSFTELLAYMSKTNLFRQPSASFSSIKLRVGAENYYNPFGPCDSPNRLPDSIIGTSVPCSGLELIIDNYRYTEVPRIVDNQGKSYRFLQGLRGQFSDWDWETAFVWSRSIKEDVTHNRISNTLVQEALNDPTSNAYNPFSGGQNTNLESALIDVRRDSEAELITFDISITNKELFTLLGNSVAFVSGFEVRKESFQDDRDPRLDGTIQFVDFEGDTFPLVSDVVNSSPTPDNEGSRNVVSLFGEMQVPLLSNLDMQLALRYENFSDVGDTTVGKFAFGWRPVDQLLMRGSWSQAFRAPNLITINEQIVVRNNTRTDYACVYAADYGGDPDQDIIECRNAIQRIAQGSEDLKPEESDNYSLGFVFEPTQNLSLTFDYWSIEKTNTIGLFGEENHSILDLVLRLEQGLNGCDSTEFNPAITRSDDISEEHAAVYTAAGICPAGDIQYITDVYTNLDDRTIRGYDIGVYYDIETQMGRFKWKYNASILTKFEQEAGGDAATIVAAKESGLLPDSIPVVGFEDLIGKDGNQDYKHNIILSWRAEHYGASLGWYRLGGFYQSSLTLDDGTRWEIPAFDSYDAAFEYHSEMLDKKTRVRLGVKNFTDERAPLADRYFGFFADAHQDYGRYFYLDIKSSVF